MLFGLFIFALILLILNKNNNNNNTLECKSEEAQRSDVLLHYISEITVYYATNYKAPHTYYRFYITEHIYEKYDSSS